MFSSAQIPGRSLQDDKVELRFVCPDESGYKMDILIQRKDRKDIEEVIYN